MEYIHYMLDVPCVYMYLCILMVPIIPHEKQYTVLFSGGGILTSLLAGLVWQYNASKSIDM